ncbi:MAG: transposase [Sulfurovum sp.]|nr:transposase [Sulfurovum sp.]
MKCIYCEHPYTYLLGNRQRKCSRCKRKFSPAKLARQKLLYRCFESEMTAKEASEKTGMHVGTVQKHYDRFREALTLQCDRDYQTHSKEVTDYDEYLYLPRSLDPNMHIAKVKHFLTLAYHGKVYNLMMPSISRLGLNPADKNEHKLLEKYLRYHTISKLSTERSTIRNFWEYFEQFILKYRGISDERFVYYLKEAEWRFNRRD